MFAARTGQASRPRRPHRLIRIASALAALLLVIGLGFSVHWLVQPWWLQATVTPESAMAETTEPAAGNVLDPIEVADTFRAAVDTLSARIAKLESLGVTFTGRLTGLEGRECRADIGLLAFQILEPLGECV